jgi:hypothetical protein
VFPGISKAPFWLLLELAFMPEGNPMPWYPDLAAFAGSRNLQKKD